MKYALRLFLNDALRIALTVGVMLTLIYGLDLLIGRATLNWLSVGILFVAPIVLGLAVATLFAFCAWAERIRPGSLRLVLFLLPVGVAVALIYWMFERQ
ncbi:MAG TPA: hypothetical protein VG943_11925 [Caulobacterales bacterium]|nr:hypothetical protein [Caulobacterales bacterium]